MNRYVDLLLGEFKHYRTRLAHGGIHKEVMAGTEFYFAFISVDILISKCQFLCWNLEMLDLFSFLFFSFFGYNNISACNRSFALLCWRCFLMVNFFFFVHLELFSHWWIQKKKRGFFHHITLSFLNEYKKQYPCLLHISK